MGAGVRRCVGQDSSGGQARDCSDSARMFQHSPSSYSIHHINVCRCCPGDDFIGTVWDRKYTRNGAQAAHFMNMLRPDAMTIGNHEVGKCEECDACMHGVKFDVSRFMNLLRPDVMPIGNHEVGKCRAGMEG